MTLTDKSLQFTAHKVEVANDYTIGERLVFQGEGEVIGSKTVGVGKDRETAITYRLMPILVAFKASEIEKKEDIGTTEKKPRARRHRDLLYVYWDQNFKYKYPEFDAYYEAYYDKLDTNIREKLL